NERLSVMDNSYQVRSNSIATIAEQDKLLSWDGSSDSWLEDASFSPIATAQDHVKGHKLAHSGSGEEMGNSRSAVSATQIPGGEVGQRVPTRQATPVPDSVPVTGSMAPGSWGPFLASSLSIPNGENIQEGEMEPGPLHHHCEPIGVLRTDYFIDVISTLPHFF